MLRPSLFLLQVVFKTLLLCALSPGQVSAAGADVLDFAIRTLETKLHQGVMVTPKGVFVCILE